MGGRLRGLDRGERAALVISECQLAIVDPALAMFPGLAEQVAARGTLASIDGLAKACREAAIPVVHCVVRLLSDAHGFEPASPLQAIMRRNPLLRHDRLESGLHPAVRVDPTDIVSERRHGITGFHDTGLESLLRGLGVQTVILVGVSTNVALPGMAIEAVNRGFSVVIPDDCTAGGSVETHDHAIRHLLPILATVTDAARIIRHIKSPARLHATETSGSEARKCAPRASNRSRGSEMGEAAVATGYERHVPGHVPPELVIESDFFSDPGYATDPFAVVASQTTGPRVFYSPTHYLLPGGWVITRAEDVRYVLQHPELFSSKGQVSFSALIDESWDLIPVELDPPHHAGFRSLLNPLFSPKEVAKLEAGVRSAAVSLIEKFEGAREIEFISAFAQPFPVSVFLQLLGLPLDEMQKFLKWEHGLLKSFHLADRKAAAANIIGYLRRTAAERRTNPGNDLVSWAVQAEVDGRPLTDDEILGICFLLFIAGLDTVASSLGFHYHYLATHPELQAQLRADRSLIPAAVEEFMRLYSIVINHRRVLVDTEVGGVAMRAGDWMSVPTFNASRDPAEFENPHEFILDRAANRHVAFSYGPHRCLGSHLARRELIVAMNEIFDRLPPFHLKEGAPHRTVGGAVFGVEELHLEFDR